MKHIWLDNNNARYLSHIQENVMKKFIVYYESGINKLSKEFEAVDEWSAMQKAMQTLKLNPRQVIKVVRAGIAA